MTRDAAANGHPIEFWLTVFPAAGIAGLEAPTFS
jgi:hypothetical protein